MKPKTRHNVRFTDRKACVAAAFASAHASIEHRDREIDAAVREGLQRYAGMRSMSFLEGAEDTLTTVASLQRNNLSAIYATAIVWAYDAWREQHA